MPRLSLDDDEDDGKPYHLSGGATKTCPKCGKEMPTDGVLCVACGFDQRSFGRK